MTDNEQPTAAATPAGDDAESEAEAVEDAESEAEAVEDVGEEQAVDGDALAEAIAENPEAVAAFVQRLDVANELLDVVALAEGAMDDEMVIRLAATADILAESADGLATRETVDLAESVGENAADLDDALTTVLSLQRSGALDDVVAAADLLSLAGSALDDDMVVSLARTANGLGEVADTASDPDTVRGIEGMLAAVGEASDPDDPPEKVGAFGLLKAMRDPEIQRGMGYLLAIAGALGRDVERRQSPE